MSTKRGKYIKRKPTHPIEPIELFKQKDGKSVDDITFSNGIKEIGFDEYINLIKN